MSSGDDRRLAHTSNPPAVSGPSVADDDRQLTQALKEYLAALESGQRPDRQEFLGRYAGVVAELGERLDGLEFIQQVAPQLQSVASSALSSAEPPRFPLGDFQIIRVLGRGGMGVVYEAEQLSLGRRVALKVLPFAATLDGRQLRRFKQEAQAAAHLHHQNIVPVHAVGCERGVHYYAMQLINGQTLAQVIGELRRAARLDGIGDERASRIEQPPRDAASAAPPFLIADSQLSTRPIAAFSTKHCNTTIDFFCTVARVGVQAAEALEYAHQEGVVHRDIKPANLLIEPRTPLGPEDSAIRPRPATTDEFRLWITDFGVAHCHRDAGLTLTLTGDLVGTLRYMSPEQALGQRAATDHRTDVYSLGVTLYELLTLEPVFTGHDRQELLRQIAVDEPRPPRALNPSIPGELETIVLKATAKSPAERYATAQELADDLRCFLEYRPIKAKRPSLGQRLAKWSRRHQPVVRLAAAFAAVAVIGLAVGSLLIWREKRSTDAALQQVKKQQSLTQAERDLAESQRKRAEQNVALALQVLDNIYLQVAERQFPRDPKREREDRELLARALDFYERFAETNIAVPSVRREVGRAYRRVGDICRLVGQPDRANDAYRRALELGEQLVAENPDRPDLRDDLADRHNVLARLLNDGGDRAAAIEQVQRSLEIADALAGDFPDVRQYRESLANAHNNLSELLRKAGQLELSLEHCRAALEIQQKLVDEFHEIADYQNKLAAAHTLLADHLRSRGERQEAADHYQQAIAIQTRLAETFTDNPEYQSSIGATLNNLGMMLRDQGELSDSRRAIEQAIEHQQLALGATPSHPSYLRFLYNHYTNLAETLIRLNEPADAALAWGHAIELDAREPWLWYYEAIARLATDDVAAYRTVCSGMVQRFGGTTDPAVALRVLYACLPAADADADQLVRLAQIADPSVPGNVRVLGAAEYRAGRYELAVAHLGEAAQRKGANAWDWCFLAMAQRQMNRVEEMLPALEKADQWIAEADRQKLGISASKRSRWGSWTERVEVVHLRREAASIIGAAAKTDSDKDNAHN
jgi:serine/threonine protein kinase